MNNVNLKWLLCFTILLAFSNIGLAQKIGNGSVSSEDGKPLLGATVTEKGTGNSVASNADGSNSGPATIAWQDLTHFKKIGKPFGVFGVTYMDYTVHPKRKY